MVEQVALVQLDSILFGLISIIYLVRGDKLDGVSGKVPGEDSLSCGYGRCNGTLTLLVELFSEDQVQRAALVDSACGIVRKGYQCFVSWVRRCAFQDGALGHPLVVVLEDHFQQVTL